ncbi:MAG: peptidoglycan-binding domain-containing protein [bacterium]|nr:peptidoglycan-binding domain-containing protein [bacterium]
MSYTQVAITKLSKSDFDNLNLNGPGSSGNETAKFGFATRAAVKQLQTNKSISPTGYFGPLTRAAVNVLIGF